MKADARGDTQRNRRNLVARLAVLDIKLRGSKNELRLEELRRQIIDTQKELDALAAGAPAAPARTVGDAPS